MGWIVAAGAAGGLLNAAWSDNRFWLPRTVLLARRSRILRPGLLLSALIGAGASVAVVYVLGMVRTGCNPSNPQLIFGGVATAVGLLSARLIANESEKRLLRAAVHKAAIAPAAHPDTVRLIEIAPPYSVYMTASQLIPHQHALRVER